MADVIVNSANTTSATENDVILSIVQDELLRAAKLRPTIMDLSSRVSKGDISVSVPKFTTSFAAPATQNPDGTTTTDFQAPVFGVDKLDLDVWVNLPYRVTDRSSAQSKVPVEAELAASAGEHMGNFIDDRIIVRLRQASAAAPDHLIDLDGADIAGAAAAITLAGISKARQLLSEQNISNSDRWLVIPPAQEKALIDLDNFTNADKYGSREALLDGEIGRIYGFRVMVHNGLATNEAMAYHKSCVSIAMQQEIKFETQRADVRLLSTDYSFSLGMGDVVMDGGKRQVYLLGA